MDGAWVNIRWMYQPSLIRTVTAGTGFPPVHALVWRSWAIPFSGVPPVGNWVLRPAPCPEGYRLNSVCSISVAQGVVNKFCEGVEKRSMINLHLSRIHC